MWLPLVVAIVLAFACVVVVGVATEIIEKYMSDKVAVALIAAVVLSYLGVLAFVAVTDYVVVM